MAGSAIPSCLMAFAEFLASRPQVRIEFVLSDATVDLIEERTDVAFRGNETLSPNYVVRQIQTIPFVLVASPSYLAAREHQPHCRI